MRFLRLLRLLRLLKAHGPRREKGGWKEGKGCHVSSKDHSIDQGLFLALSAASKLRSLQCMGCRPQGQGAVRAIAGRFNELLEHVQSEQLGLFGIPGISQ